MPETVVRPGDFGLQHCRTDAGLLIGAMEVLDELAQGRSWTRASRAALYRHVFGVESVDADGTVHALEAWPGGARRNTYRLDDPDILWSSSSSNPVLQLTDGQRDEVVAWWVRHLGARYSFADYAAQLLTRLHVPLAARWMLHRVETSGHFLCSQWIDCGWLAAGAHLFSDGRPPGLVAPSDLADLVAA
jgi:hypothetical protein